MSALPIETQSPADQSHKQAQNRSQDQAAALAVCDLCGTRDEEELSLVDRDGSYLRTVVCRCCGLVYSSPRPSSDELRNYYHHEYRKDYKATFQPKPKHVYRSGKVALERLRRLAQFLPPRGKVMDFGAGGGEVVFMLRALGHDARGFEPNEGYAGFAANVLGLPVQHGFYQTVQVDPESLDAVTAFHVIEHVDSPYQALSQVRQWLKPGGRFVVEVPNVEAVCQWPRSTFHRAHLYNFNAATLDMMGAKAGYRTVGRTVSPDGGNITAVFEKTDAAMPATLAIAGNYERVRDVVRGHSVLQHVLSIHPYVRPWAKLSGRIEERLAVSKSAAPKDILERLAAQATRG